MGALMQSMLRSIVAVILGFILASAVMMLVESANGKLIYPELGKSAQGITDRDALRELLANAPVGAFLVVIIGWSLGGIAGGWGTARLAKNSKIGHSLALGILLTLAGIANNLMIPPPIWFWVVSLLVLLPSAYLGGKLAIGKPKA